MTMKKLVIIISLIFILSVSMTTARDDTTQDECLEYCSDSTHYIRGVYNERADVCDYSNEICEFGCDREGLKCNTRIDSSVDEPEELEVPEITHNVERDLTIKKTETSLRIDTTLALDDSKQETEDEKLNQEQLRVGNSDLCPNDPGPDPMSESNPQPSPAPIKMQLTTNYGRSNLIPNYPNLWETEQIKNKGESVFVDKLTEMKEGFLNLINGFLNLWPEGNNADYFGSEILIESHHTWQTVTDKLDTHHEKNEDLFTFYLPGDSCDLVVDVCLNQNTINWGEVDQLVYLDTFEPITYVEMDLFNYNPQCMEGYGPCEYIYFSSVEGKSCEFKSEKNPSSSFVGEICEGSEIVGNILEGTEVKPIIVSCSMKNPATGLPMCHGENNLERTIDINYFSNCNTLKAENIKGGFHFLSLDNLEFSYLRYTYACDKKFFG